MSYVFAPAPTVAVPVSGGGSFPVHRVYCVGRNYAAHAAELDAAIAEKEARDFRDTAVTRLALAGCTLAQICAITGHTFETATSIMRHYLALQPEMADAAIGLLNTWMAEQGIAV